MKYLLIATALVCSSSYALACNGRQLEEDLKFCVDTSAQRNGRGDVVAGAYEKDARRLDAGFNACQSHSGTAKDNYGKCSPGQKIDTARAVLKF